MTTFDLAEVMQRMRDKSYCSIGEAFESLLADELCVAQEFVDPLPADLAEVEAFWSEP